MKTLRYVLLLLILSATTLKAQQGFNYQASLRDNTGNILKNTHVDLRFTILQGSVSGTNVYEETQPDSTNDLGLVHEMIGQGTPVSGVFSAIDWSQQPYFMQVELSVASGPFTNLGTYQLSSVPYALYAAKSGNKVLPGSGITISNDSIYSTWTTSGNDITNNNSGNVGIGTSPANQKLEVNGGVKIGNTSNSAQGSIRYTGSDFEGATGSGWTSLTQSNTHYYEMVSSNYVGSTARNTMVLSTDSLIVPETGYYLIIYTGRGFNGYTFDISSGIYDNEGRTGVIDVSANLNWVGQEYAMAFNPYKLNTSVASYYGYIDESFTVIAYSSLTAGDVLKAGAANFSTGTPTTTWGFTPFKIKLIKIN